MAFLRNCGSADMRFALSCFGLDVAQPNGLENTRREPRICHEHSFAVWDVQVNDGEPGLF